MRTFHFIGNMAYVGNRNGPRESEIVSRLGAGYFGITEEALQSEIEWYEDDERKGAVTPVRQNSDGRYFIVFSAPGGGTQEFYLDQLGYSLEGKVRHWELDARIVEIKP